MLENSTFYKMPNGTELYMKKQNGSNSSRNCNYLAMCMQGSSLNAGSILKLIWADDRYHSVIKKNYLKKKHRVSVTFSAAYGMK